MKKKLFSCFHPLALETGTETETDQIKHDSSKKVIKIAVQPKNSKRAFLELLEVLLHKASLKIKVSERKLSLRTKNARLRTIHRRMQIAGGGEKGDKGVEEAKVSVSDKGVRSLHSSCSSHVSGSTTVAQRQLHSPMPRSFDHKTNPCLCLLVVALFFTVVWGRVRAVLFALVFIYLFPAWSGFLR